MENNGTADSMCNDCKALVGAGRYTKLHANLSYVDGHKVSSMMGAADEANYRCKMCGHEWLHETSSYGMGWIG